MSGKQLKKELREKPYFQQFVEANQALIDCYERANSKDPKGDAGILATCAKPREQIEDLLRRDVLSMTHLIQQRIPIMHENKKPPVEVVPKLW